MELRPDIRRCLDQFLEIRSRLSVFHTCAQSEIQAALEGCLLLDPGLCVQAARCLDSVKAASADLADSRPLLLLSGPGAFATLAECFADDGGAWDDPAAEVAAADAGFSRLRGLLSLEHDPGLDGRTARLRRLGAEPGAAAAATATADAREFVDWAAAGRWLGERVPAELLQAGVGADEAASGAADWELRLRCPELERLRVLVAPRLGRWTRSRLRHHLPSCALFLHHADFAGEDPEGDLREAVEHCLVVRTDQKDILMMHNRLHFVCRSEDGAEGDATRQRAADLAEAALRDFTPDSAERRRRVLIRGGGGGGGDLSSEVQELLGRQLAERGQGNLRQLLTGLCGLSRAVRGVRGCQLAGEVSSAEQLRSPSQFSGDLDRLQSSARSAARSFQRSLEGCLSELSAQIERHLRQQEVKDRLASEYVEYCLKNPQLTHKDLEQFLLEQVGQELHNWNRETQVLLKLDRDIWKRKAEHFQKLCRRAERIPELVALPSGSFSEPPPPHESSSTDDSLSSRTVVSVGIRQIGSQQMKPSFLQSLAVGIGMPLFVPLAAITMAIIWPVTVFKRLKNSTAEAASADGAPKLERKVSKKSVKRLQDQAWDFFDKIGRQFINENFFNVTRHFLLEDARKLEKFVEHYCIVPKDMRKRSELAGDPRRLQAQFDEFHKRLHGLVTEAKLFGATNLGYEMLRADQCLRLGIDCGVASESLLGDRIGGGSFSGVFALPAAAAPRQRLALKLINASSTGGALFETEMMRELASDPHQNLLLGLGSVYFPQLHRIGLIMPRCDCNLRQLLERNRHRLVPAAAPPDQRNRAMADCMRLYRQILAGVRHLHGKRILHRDLKLENVLADLPDVGGDPGDPGEARLRICDFGFAKEEEALSGSSFVGTFGYLAPELTPPNPMFSVKSDIFSLGVMLWECYYGVSAPRVGNSQIAVVLNGDSGLDFLIKLMTHSSPQERPHIEQCIAMLTLRERNADQPQSLRLISRSDSLRSPLIEERSIVD